MTQSLNDRLLDLARLEGADRGSLDLDGAVHRALIEPITHDVLAGSHTTSLDGVVALVERCLPGWCFLMAWNGERGIANVHVVPLGVHQEWTLPGEASTPALALCTALMLALIARAEMEPPHA